MELQPEHAGLAAYFNVDNGTGTIRGVYQQGNETVAPIFAAWMEPFANLGMTSSSTARGRTTRTWTTTSACSRRT
jgi:hypothetical protein